MLHPNPRKFQQNPVEIEAIQFTGTWSSALEIMHWAENVYFVALGYDHQLRRKEEYDHCNGDILDHAQAFLVVKNGIGDQVRLDRVSRDGWVLKEVFEGGYIFSAMTNGDFLKTYVELERTT